MIYTHAPFSGTYTALVTPFMSNLHIDFDALERLIEDQIAEGIDGLVVLGTTGESPTITHEEYRDIICFTAERVKRRARIVVGVGSNNTQHTIDYAREAKELGADALLVVNPYYNKPTQEGLYLHFMAIADAVDLPQIVYNIKGRTAVNIETSTLMRLTEHGNIVAVKEASGDINQMMDVLSQVPSDFAVLSGDDSMTLPLMCMGGHGVISVLSNILPAQVRLMVNAAQNGNYRKACQIHYSLLPLMKGCFLETNPLPVKTALAMQGKIEEVFRLPMCTMQPGIRAAWQQLLLSHYAFSHPHYESRRHSLSI